MTVEAKDWEEFDGDVVFYYTMLINEIYDIRGIDKECYYAEGQITILGFDAYPCLTKRGLKTKHFVVTEHGNGRKSCTFSRKIAKQTMMLSR